MSQKALKFVQNSLQIATVCGLVPIIAGFLTYVSWVTIEWNQVPQAAFYVVFLGALLLVMGIVALVGAYIVARKLKIQKQTAFRSHATLAFSMLAVNLPIFVTLTAAGYSSWASYRVTLINRSSRDYPEAKLIIRDREIAVPIKKGETVKKKFEDLEESTLHLQLEPSSPPVVIEGYVTKGLPTNRVVIQPDGSLTTPKVNQENQQALPIQREP